MTRPAARGVSRPSEVCRAPVDAVGAGPNRECELLVRRSAMADSRPGSEPRILLVEDDHELRQSLSEALQDAGYHVDSAGNGREALDYLEENAPPCLVLLDLMMPVMNGWEFREEQLRRKSVAGVPVVILTADGRADIKVQMLRADGFLRKPIELERLFGLLAEYGCGNV